MNIFIIFVLISKIFSPSEISTNLGASADDVDLITDFDTNTYLTLSNSALTHWKLSFDLQPAQSAPFYVYVYGSDTLCTTPHLALVVSMVGTDDGCVYHDTFDVCSFIAYNSADHESGFCKYSCNCQTTCTWMSLNVLSSMTSGVSHVLKEVTWQPVVDLTYS